MIYKRTNITSKTGLNFVRGVVEEAGSLFHKIEQENDLGVDGLIEFVRGDAPLGKQIAVQVKSGKSYFNSKSDQCLIPIESHRDYWSTYPLPIIGVVYIPSLKRAHWIDIKPYLRRFPEAAVIRFTASEANLLDAESFQRVFLPTILQEVPEIPLSQALSLLHPPRLTNLIWASSCSSVDIQMSARFGTSWFATSSRSHQRIFPQL